MVCDKDIDDIKEVIISQLWLVVAILVLGCTVVAMNHDDDPIAMLLAQPLNELKGEADIVGP